MRFIAINRLTALIYIYTYIHTHTYIYNCYFRLL